MSDMLDARSREERRHLNEIITQLESHEGALRQRIILLEVENMALRRQIKQPIMIMTVNGQDYVLKEEGP